MLNKNKLLALIPARAGSQRIKNKNIAPLCGKPLMLWTVDFALSSKLFEAVVVSSDSPDILALATQAGATPLLRPPELAADNSGDEAVIRHALQECPCDLVAYLRPTTPFREVAVAKKAIEHFRQFKFSSLRSVEEHRESAFKSFTFTQQGKLEPIWWCDRLGWPAFYLQRFGHAGAYRDVTDLPNQEVEKTYHPNGYVDLIPGDILDRGYQDWRGKPWGLWGPEKGGFITPHIPEIDTPEDLEYAEFWYERRTKR